jgi:hypothetical protein
MAFKADKQLVGGSCKDHYETHGARFISMDRQAPHGSVAAYGGYRLPCKIEERQAVETAHRVLDITRQVCEYWLPAAEMGQRNITDGLKARLQPYRGKLSSHSQPKRLGEMFEGDKTLQGRHSCTSSPTTDAFVVSKTRKSANDGVD